MIDVEQVIREELDRVVPAPAGERADWRDVRRRAGYHPRRRRVAAASALVAVAAGLVFSPLGGAISRTLGGFSDWLTGTPGEPAPERAQRLFERANDGSGARFPGDPRLKELVRVDLDGRIFHLYGFETREVVCLRVAVRRVDGAGPQSACVSRADLRRSGDLVLPVKANMSVGHAGPLPRDADDPPTVPRYLLTFGLAAAEVATVEVEADSGTTSATVRNGAFLHVLEPGRRGVWARRVLATAEDGRTDTIPISVQASGQPPLRTGLRPHGPGAVDRVVEGGKIGWLEGREPRGVSAREAGLHRGGCCTGFVRVVYPDPDDFLGVALGDETLWAGPKPPLFPTGDDLVCWGLVTRGGSSASCTEADKLFARGPLHLSWGFSGGGQQIWIVSGLASDDVARIEVFAGDGRRWEAPLRDNATAFRVQRAKFPIRVVGYDRAGRVIAVETIRGG